MLETEFDKPPDKEIECMLCYQPMTVRHHWVRMINKWMHATCHDSCVENWEKQHRVAKAAQAEHQIPERFQDYDLSKANQEAVRLAGAFSPQSRYKTLAIIGVRARGKSRLMWQVIKQFFSDLEAETGTHRWVDYYIFPDLVTAYDRTLLATVKMGKYVFIDDIGCTESFGRERAQLQDIIRTRVQKGQWTFLTIDNVDFDPGLADFFKERAVAVYLDQ
jgi:chromosomal replication initiation ATPase DnaA